MDLLSDLFTLLDDLEGPFADPDCLEDFEYLGDNDLGGDFEPFGDLDFFGDFERFKGLRRLAHGLLRSGELDSGDSDLDEGFDRFDIEHPDSFTDSEFIESLLD